MISNKKVVNDLVFLLSEFGVKHVVISPGSRNAPLIMSFTNREEFTCYSIVDERSAGYFALGIAQQKREPVAIVCTSGTASLNYVPAVAEAYLQELPLVVLTADRPIERIGQGEGQSIFQKNIYTDHIKLSVEIHESNDSDTIRHNHRKISGALIQCTQNTSGSFGPIHINIPLNESLYDSEEFPSSFPKPILIGKSINTIAPSEISWIENHLKNSKKILVLVGSLSPSKTLVDSLAKWAEMKNALVMTETTSNITNDSFIPCIDRLIMSFNDENSREFHPDLLITIGSNIISKKIKFLLRNKKIAQHWHIHNSSKIIDTYQTLTKVFNSNPIDFFEQTLELGTAESSYPKKWKSEELICKENQRLFDSSVSFSDYSIVKDLLANLPQDSILQMGNSSLVRYVQLFDSRKDITYYSNRGTSGIDGCTSTAVGFSVVTDKDVYLLIGDISFFYDSNAFWNKYLSKRLKIIVVNNGNGNIFNIIDGPSKTKSLDFFTTKHNLKADKICEMHDVNYLYANTQNEFNLKLNLLTQSESCSLLEVNTSEIDNAKILKDFFINNSKKD